ncbi:MAG: hypothetical protein L0Z53_20315 [Acidobacteriales bacterium]|nr:hypothetical protein [Terriglobales bacterium]
MLRGLVLTAVLGVFVADSAAQYADGTASPKASLILPADVPSEKVQIDYFLKGPFGGYGSFVRTEKKRTSYEIDVSVEGRSAEVVKVIAYLPGCEIVTLIIPVKAEASIHQLPCKELPSVALQGQIFPVSLTQEQPAEVEVHYVATWSHDFFGLKDGKVTTFRLGSAVPDRDGKITFELPAFYRQDLLKDGYFYFRLLTGNTVAYLRPENSERDELQLRPSYSAEVRFLAER